MTETLISRVNERRRNVDELVRQRNELDRRLEVAQIELKAYEDALSLVSAARSTQGADRDAHSPEARTSHAGKKRAINYAAARMGEPWRHVFDELIARAPRSMTNGEMKELLAAKGIAINDQSLRSSVHKYFTRGWLNRVEFGKYAITDTGRDAMRSRAGRLLAKLDDDRSEDSILGGAKMSPHPQG